MCVLAAYIGARPAAPVLLDMLGREEGLAGGYYTGIATLHDGKLYYEKVLGDLRTLRRETPAADLPGQIGIIHSRSASGGDREWSHPFVDCAGRLAYVANGAPGWFAGKTDLSRAGSALLRDGHRFRAVSPEAVGNYLPLADGRWVHLSDIMCHAIEVAYSATGDLARAAADSYQAWPGEIVGLALHADSPDHFVAARINMPLMLGRDEEGVYAASAAIAFPPGVSWQAAMPANAAAAFSRDGVRILPFAASAVPVAPMPSADSVAATLVAGLRRGELLGVGALGDLTKPLWPEGCLNQKTMLVYQTLAALLAEGKVELVTDRVPGMYGRGQAPRTRARWLANGGR